MAGDRDTEKHELDIAELSRLVDGSDPDGEISIDAILAEYRESAKAPAGQLRPAPYRPETDKELSREIAGIVNAVLDEGEQRKYNARKYDAQTKRQNRMTEHYETLANTAALSAETVVSAHEKKKLEKVARKAARQEEKLRLKQERRERKQRRAEGDTLDPPPRRGTARQSLGDTVRLPAAGTLKTLGRRPIENTRPLAELSDALEAAPDKEPPVRSREDLREEILRELPVRPSAGKAASDSESVPSAAAEKPAESAPASKVISLEAERSRRDGKKTAPEKPPKASKPPKPKQKKAKKPPISAEERHKEPSIAQALKGARGANTLMSTRSAAALVFGIVMLYMTAAGELGLPMLRLNDRTFLAILFALNVAVSLLCLDVLLYGLSELATLKPGSMCLLTVADLLTLIESLIQLIGGPTGGLQPMNAVCSMALAAAMVAERRRRRTMVALYKAASGVSSPYVVTAEPAERFGRSALVKTETPPEGFVTLSRKPDKCTRMMQIMGRVLLLFCPVLAEVAVLLGKCQAGFFAVWSVLAVVVVPLSMGMASTLPLKYVTEKLAKTGCAVAGFGGAELIARQKRVVVTDRDIFPPGCVGFNGMKIVDSRSTEKIISVTASLVRASGSDLTRLFTDLMNEQMGQWREIEDFAFMDGGFGGVVEGEYVMCGNAEFMRIRGIELPKGLRAKNAVFTSFGKQLAGVFALNYTATPAAEEALNILLYNGSQPFLASTDFNVTPAYLETRFRLARGRVATPEKGTITADEYGTPPAAAVICREGMAPYADTVTGGRRLAGTVRTNTIYVLFSMLVGLLLCAGLVFLGAEHVLTQGKMAVYAVAWVIPVWLTSLGVKRY